MATVVGWAVIIILALVGLNTLVKKYRGNNDKG